MYLFGREHIVFWTLKPIDIEKYDLKYSETCIYLSYIIVSIFKMNFTQLQRPTWCWLYFQLAPTQILKLNCSPASKLLINFVYVCCVTPTLIHPQSANDNSVPYLLAVITYSCIWHIMFCILCCSCPITSNMFQYTI
jgi:hypothetical protein